jgi:asparagine synthase (glutamine-hydrolysing)
LFQWKEIEDLIRRHLERRANLGYHLWGLLVLFLWMRRWGIQSAPLPERQHRISPVVSATN